MPLVNVWECEECEKLEKGSSDPTGDRAPEGWLDVAVHVIGGEDNGQPPPSQLFCSPKCMGLHFRPIQRRGKNGADDDQEEHPAS